MTVKKDPWFRNRLIREGIYHAIREAMQDSRDVYILGEGSHMKVHFDAPGIEKEFPDRVITMPISEDANSNFAVGMSLAGLVPIVDVISSDFLYRTMDAICNTMAKSGTVGNPRTMIVRAEFLTGGPTSGQRIEALFAHIPGLRVAIPSNPRDAYWLMRDALQKKAITIFFEDRVIEDTSMPARYMLPASFPEEVGSNIDRARVSLIGSRCTVVSYGVTCRIAEDALLHQDCTVIDLRTLYPLDITTILNSIKSTGGRLLVIEPDTTFLGIGAEILATVAEAKPGCKVKRLGAPHATIPACRDLHDQFMPTAEQILRAVEDLSS